MIVSLRHYPPLFVLAGFAIVALASGCVARQQSADSTSSGGSVAAGSYECSTLSDGELQAAASENFTISDSSDYLDASGNQGTYSVDGDTMTFQGAALDGQRAKYTPGVVHSENPPSIEFLSADGSLGDTCQPH